MERNKNVKENFEAITNKIAKLPESIQASLFLFMVYHRNLVGYFWSEYLKFYPEINGNEWGNYDPQSFKFGYDFDKGCQQVSIMINGKQANFDIYSPESQNISDWGYKIVFAYDGYFKFEVEEVKGDEPFVKITN